MKHFYSSKLNLGVSFGAWDGVSLTSTTETSTIKAIAVFGKATYKWPDKPKSCTYYVFGPIRFFIYGAAVQ